MHNPVWMKKMFAGASMVVLAGCATGPSPEQAVDSVDGFYGENPQTCFVPTVGKDGAITASFNQKCATHEKQKLLIEYALEAGKWPIVDKIMLADAIENSMHFGDQLRNEDLVGDQESVIAALRRRNLVNLDCQPVNANDDSEATSGLPKTGFMVVCNQFVVINGKRVNLQEPFRQDQTGEIIEKQSGPETDGNDGERSADAMRRRQTTDPFAPQNGR